MNFYSWLFAPRGVVSLRPRLPRGVACDADVPSAPTSPFTSDGERRHIDGSRCYKPVGEPCRRDKELIAVCSAFAEKEDDFGSMPMLTKKPKEGETPKERAVREYNEVVARYTDKNGKRKKGWLKAPNGKPTNLTERQWVMVRTPSFKAWFGDWEAVATVRCWHDIADSEPFKKMEAEDVSLIVPIVEKKALMRAFTAWNKVTNEGDNRTVVFPNASAGKILHCGKVSGALKILFEKSRRMWSEDDDGRHPNITGIHHYLARAKTDDGEVYVHFTVREDNREKNEVHAATVSDVEVYTKKAEITPGKNLAKSAVERASAPFTDDKIAYFFNRVNPDFVSKIVDENGEPLPVYHGTNADFTTFDIDGACGGAAYFAFDRDYVREHYGQGVKECFLNVRKPIGEDEMYDRYGVDFSSLNEQMIDATRQAVNKVKSDGYDGVIGTTFDSESNEKKAIAVFLASQIASANQHFGMTNE